MIITSKRKLTSFVAVLCAFMILIGIVPTSVFNRGNVNAAANETGWTLYVDTNGIIAWFFDANCVPGVSTDGGNTYITMEEVTEKKAYKCSFDTKPEKVKFARYKEGSGAFNVMTTDIQLSTQPNNNCAKLTIDGSNNVGVSEWKNVDEYSITIDFTGTNWNNNHLDLNSLSIYLYNGDTDKYSDAPVIMKELTNGQYIFNWITVNNRYNNVIFAQSPAWGGWQTTDITNIQWNNQNEIIMKIGSVIKTAYGLRRPHYEFGNIEYKAQSSAGQPLSFIDMTKGAGGNIKALFSTDKNFSEFLSIDGKYVTVPEDKDGIPYQYVKFSINGKETEVYNIRNVINQGGIFYYGATEKGDTIVSYWGTSVESTVTNKDIYLDNIAFPINSSKVPRVKIGNTTLEVREVGENNRAYQFSLPNNTNPDDIISLTYDGATYNFMAGNTNSNMLTLSNEIAKIKGTYQDQRRIYFDATLSKLSYANQNIADATMPVQDGNIYAHLFGSGSETSTRQMIKANESTIGSNTWKDVYYIEVTNDDIQKYNNIIFFSNTSQTWPAENSMSRTGTLTLPKDNKNICFYADTSDAGIYTVGPRDGYWGEPYKIRDVETGKADATGKPKDIVDIKKENFTRDPNKLYINSTFYDYYSDYELNGNNRDGYGAFSASHRSWVPFRQFDQALSDYYQSKNVRYPIYTGHFQPPVFPNDTLRFEYIKDTMNLYGYDSAHNGDFFVINNSVNSKLDGATDNGRYAYTLQGLVNESLKDKQDLMTAENEVQLPHFNKDFILGNNSKNTKLGEVYENVAFPFTKKDVFNNGVEYWWFDSNQTTLLMTQDNKTDSYYLRNPDSKYGNCENLNSSSKQQNTWGLFPFNETSKEKNANTYNYGYGTKLEFNFRLTADGTVKGTGDQDFPIQFLFSGDDDVWIYIDGELVLDVGGAHGESQGLIDFAEKKAYVSKVKAGAGSDGNIDNPIKNTVNYHGEVGNNNITATYNFADKKDFSKILPDTQNGEEHTLTMYYMERGMWESNMKVAFNFPDENKLEVEKKVNTDAVNPQFKDFFNSESLFTVDIKNLATHYGPQSVDSSTAKTITVKHLPNGQNTEEQEKNINVGYDLNKSEWCNTFEHTNQTISGRSGIIHWYTDEWNDNADHVGAAEKRSGIIQLRQTMDISQMEQLRFDMCTTNTGINMQGVYICLTDTNGKKAYAFLNADNVDGTPGLEKNAWSTFKVILSKLNYDSGFDSKHVSKICFQYDQIKDRNQWTDVYIDKFIFQPTTQVTTTLGFVKDQAIISDYGSAGTGKLEAPIGAIYNKSSTGKMQTMIDSKFTIGNNTKVTFYDQFRRGSYISLKEELTPRQELLFTTSHTVYEDNMPVGQVVDGNYSTVQGGCNTLTNIQDNITRDEVNDKIINDRRGTYVDDGRTEKVITSDSSNRNPSSNNAYTNNPVKPNDNTFVFRSYSNPDAVQNSTSLKVVFTNTVRVSDLVVEKQQPAADRDNHALQGTYRFYVEFTNIGGISLVDSNGKSSVIVGPFDLKVGEQSTITGIPVGTEYTIHEVVSRQNDESDQAVIDNILGYVDQTEPEVTDRVNFNKDTIDIGGVKYNTWAIHSSVSYETTKTWRYRFYNIFMPTISLKLEKTWEDVPENYNLPRQLKFKLERYGTLYEKDAITGEMTPVTDGNGQIVKKWQDVPGQSEIVLEPGESSNWEIIINDLNKYVNGQQLKVDGNGDVDDRNAEQWHYKITEITPEGDFPFTVTYGGHYGHNGDYNATAGDNTPAKLTVTNKYKAPNVGSITIVKVAANNAGVKLPGAKFALYTNKECTNKYQDLPDTGNDGTATLSNIPYGTYYLKEEKAPAGYVLLDKAIEVKVESSGTQLVGDYPNNEIANVPIVMPEAGGDGGNPNPFNFVLFGAIAIALAGGLLLLNKKYAFLHISKSSKEVQ